MRKLVGPGPGPGPGSASFGGSKSGARIVARNAMPAPGDTDGAGISEEAGDAPHAVVALPATSEIKLVACTANCVLTTFVN